MTVISAPAAPRSLTFQVVMFTAIRLVINTAERMVYPFLAIFARGMSVDLTAMAVVISTANATSGLGPVLGPLADRRGRKFSMLLGLAVFTVGSLAAALWPSYVTFFISILAAHIGNVIFLPAMFAYLGDSVPYEKRGTVVAATETSWALAFVVGVPAAGGLIAGFGWSGPFWALALFGSLGFLGVLLYADNRRPQATESAARHFTQSIRTLLTSPRAWAGLLLGFTVVAANDMVNMVFGVWMEDTFFLQLAALSGASAVIGIAELAGEGIVALAADRLGKERVIAAGILINIAVLACLPLLSASTAAALVWLFLFYLTFELIIVSTLPVMTEVLPEQRATMLSAYIGAVSLGRAAASLVAARIYGAGFASNVIGAVILNLAALLALRLMRRKAAPRPA